MTPRDKELWLDLADKVISKNKDVARIHSAVKRLKGRVGAIPDGWHYRGSPFHQLFTRAVILKGGDADAREALRVHAEAVLGVLNGEVSAPGVVAGIAPHPNPLPVNGERGQGRARGASPRRRRLGAIEFAPGDDKIRGYGITDVWIGEIDDVPKPGFRRDIDG